MKCIALIKKNIFDHPTNSAYGYACWLEYIEELKEKYKFITEIPTKEKYEFIHKSIYGGRVSANIKKFINIQYYDLLNQELLKINMSKDDYVVSDEKTKNMIDIEISKKMNYIDVKKLKDFIFNGDVSSLYPTSMAGNDIFKVKFPVGFSRWSEEPEKEFNENKYGFYEIEYV